MRALALLSICCLVSGCPSSKDECQVDTDCPGGRYCQAGTCAFDCTYDRECPEGYACTARGRCTPGCVKTNGGLEACDGEDNDCDGDVDEDFAGLGETCRNGGCPPGLMVCTPDGTGLECDGPVPTADDALCDGLDGDCDGLTDEDAADQPCPLQAGVCAGAFTSCQAGAWTACDYGADYSPDLDSSCDQVDNDCDGQTDEDAAPIPEPELQQQADDGLDNNCNGVVDEPGGIMIAVDENFAIDVYEISVYDQADCTGTQYGLSPDDFPAGFPVEGQRTTTLYACSMPSQLPSGYLSWFRARWACQAQGKRLCTATEWQKACQGPDRTAYPYGQYLAAPACNIGWNEPADLAPTGYHPQCTNSGGAFDMSGNLFEWVWDEGRYGPDTALLGGGAYACLLCDAGLGCRPCDNPSDLERIERMSNCEPDLRVSYESFYRYLAYAWLGTRCCLDIQ